MVEIEGIEYLTEALGNDIRRYLKDRSIKQVDFVYRFLFSSCHNKRPPMIYILP